jgi:hypothetical protein
MPELIVGQRIKLEMVSFSHGAVRVPLAQSFDYNPQYTERKLFEFDNPATAAIIDVFDGVTVRFSYFDSDSNLVDAMLNDRDPTDTVVLYDPSTLLATNLFLNIKRETTGKIFQSVLINGFKASGVSTTEPVREESQVTVDGSCLNAYRLKGAAILYTRVLAASPDSGVYAQGIPPNSWEDSAWDSGDDDVDLAKDAVAITGNPYGDSALVLLAVKNGVAVTTGFTAVSSMDTTTITLDESPAATDIWEFYSAYLDS